MKSQIEQSTKVIKSENLVSQQLNCTGLGRSVADPDPYNFFLAVLQLVQYLTRGMVFSSQY